MSDAQSRLSEALTQYERASHSIAAPRAPQGGHQSGAAAAGEETRYSWGDHARGGEEREPFGKYEQTMYGLGRLVERCAQEVRFGRDEVVRWGPGGAEKVAGRVVKWYGIDSVEYLTREEAAARGHVHAAETDWLP